MLTDKKDNRDCPSCRNRMEQKGTTDSPDEVDNAIELWQCPKCKNVELL